MRALFWGTPAFATPALRALVGEGHEVVAAITQPDRPVGRHHNRLESPPVKVAASEEGIPVIQPESARQPDLADQLQLLQPDISVVVAYGQILPADIISLPARGTINIHASLLPLLRGAAPIQTAIRDGLDVTGISVMQMVRKLDAGPVILQNETPILSDETFGELQLRLSELGALSLIEALVLMELDKATPTPQDDDRATYAPRITREDARIDWNRDCLSVSRMIRAFDPRPGAFSTRLGAEVRLFGVRPFESVTGEPGHVLDIDESGMLVGCSRGSVRIAYVHPAGKRRMASLDWSQGRGVATGDVFGTG